MKLVSKGLVRRRARYRATGDPEWTLAVVRPFFLLCFMFWIPDPSTRQPLTWHSFAREFLLPILCYYVTALLVITPRTFFIRLALLPISLYSAFRCATRLDLVKGFPDEERIVYVNQGLLLAMTTLATRVIIWTCQLEPYHRVKYSTGNTALDALDLFCNLRGTGWSWSTGLKVPPERRNTSSTPSFLLSTSRSLLTHLLLFDFSLYLVQSFGFSALDPTHAVTGTSIFLAPLPPLQRYLRSSFISILSGLVVYYAIHLMYNLITIISVMLFAHTPDQWPPLFQKPWYATSLNEFWACRWHQLFRHNFIAFGGGPGFFFFGRIGAVMSAFLVSGVLHYIGLWGMGRGSDFFSVAGFFLLMGFGVLMELAFKSMTGHRVGGFFGWLWSMLWLLAWGNLLVDAWLIRGLAGSLFSPQEQRPSVMLVRFVQEHGWLKS
ncbi:hypothetical protein CPB84DRAFT_1727385 [Gymnopilus junonius]|uniref:Wax synthase domain-containing protein n=1 Tax=Gymnopilus junonius TaxID=109634 RepID=A0A9P5TP88_GYMJU|nr:hypothetical protein CPB84DRAFT_1727385 [Gymnopilus junonius]